MRKLFVLAILFLTYNTLQGQSLNSPVYENEGFYGNVSILGVAWTFDDFNIDAESGAGLGLKIGYNFNSNIGIFTSLDGAGIESDEGDSYGLGHFDIGVLGIFRSTTDRIRPFVRASLVGMSAQDDDVEINGGGYGLGAGLYISLTEKLAFDMNYTHSWIDISEVKLGSQAYNVDESATTGRFYLGLTYNF